MLFVVFQCMKNVLAQVDTVDSSTVSKHIKSTMVKHEVAFNPGSPTSRCLRLFVIMLLIAPPKSNIVNFCGAFIFNLFVNFMILKLLFLFSFILVFNLIFVFFLFCMCFGF